MVYPMKWPDISRSDACGCLREQCSPMYPPPPQRQSPVKSSELRVRATARRGLCAKPDQYELINRRRQLEGPWGRTHTHTHTCRTHSHGASLYSCLSSSLASTSYGSFISFFLFLAKKNKNLHFFTCSPPSFNSCDQRWVFFLSNKGLSVTKKQKKHR